MIGAHVPCRWVPPGMTSRERGPGLPVGMQTLACLSIRTCHQALTCSVGDKRLGTQVSSPTESVQFQSGVYEVDKRVKRDSKMDSELAEKKGKHLMMHSTKPS